MTNARRYTLAAAGVAIGGFLTARAITRRRRSFDFRGRTVLVTGGSRGLGLLLAREFGRKGARVAICARDEAELERAKRDLTRRGVATLALRCDLMNADEIRWMIETIRERWGPIDVLVNNAGLISVGPLETMTARDFEIAMGIHFWAPLHATLAVLPDMRRARQGRIVNISSIGGKVGVPHLVPYCASKFALAGLSDAMRPELLKDGVIVTTVYPGLMRTGSPRNADFKGRHREEYTWFAVSDSLPGMSIDADRAARAIVKACRRGEAEAVISISAQTATKARALFPELVTDLLGLVNRAMPAPGGIGTRSAKGRDSESRLAPSLLTRLSERAARRNNQLQTEAPG